MEIEKKKMSTQTITQSETTRTISISRNEVSQESLLEEVLDAISGIAPPPKISRVEEDEELVIHLMWRSVSGPALTVSIYEGDSVAVSMLSRASRYYEPASTKIDKIAKVTLASLELLSIID
eukprot:TRINITY_DN240_c0_g2_i2.p1 TRINITY_DN240_c0_g2~~TRINITY_DN240_c0_g2_i2.p1  ORF type:complete len:122 (+),score=35.07 TRINITY_DN240_c0_g2_i2:162-527(+)